MEKIFELIGLAIRLQFVVLYKIFWVWTLKPLFNILKARFQDRLHEATKFRTVTSVERGKLELLVQDAGLFEKREDGILVPDFIKKEGCFFLTVLNSHKPEQYEKHLRGFGEIFGTDFVSLLHVDGNVYQLIENKLPDIVKYDEKPENTSGFWVGTDFMGRSVEIDFMHTPAMLITGASGSGKSVFGLCLVSEAEKAGYEVHIVDGKGGIDWLDAPCSSLIIEMEEIAVHYEKLVEEMNARLAKLVEYRCKNWIEATEAGHEMKPILSFMDESSDFFDVGSQKTDKNYAVKWRIINAVSELCRKSRAVGIYQAFSLQAAKADSVPNDVKNNSGFRVSYALPTAAMSQTLFESSIAFDPTLRGGKGVFKGVEGEPVIFRGAYIG